MCYKINLIVTLLAVGLLNSNSLSADIDPRLIEPPGSEHISTFEPSGIEKHLRFWPRNLPGQPEKDFDSNLYASFILERNSEPSWTGQEMEQGFVVCADHWQRPMFDLFVPSRGHLIKALSCSAAKAEYESIQLGVFALSDLSNVRMTVNLDLPFKAYRYVPVDHKLPVGEMVGGRHLVKKQDMKMPYFLFPEPQYKKVEKGKTYGFWITVRVPEDARPGEHVGTVRITADNRKAFELPLKVMVRPFVLPKPKIAFGSYFDLRDLMKPEYHGVKFRRMYYEDMAAHGMNTAVHHAWHPWQDKKQGLYDPRLAKPWMNSRDGTWNEEGLIEEANLMKQAGMLDGGPLYIMLSNWESLPVAKIPRAVENLRRLQDKIGVEIITSSWEEPVPPYGPKIKYLKPWHKAGMGFVASTGARPELEVLGPYHAAMLVNATIVDYAAKQMLDKADAEFWTYDCANHGFAPMYARGYAGLFSWNAGVKGNMVWAYTNDRGVKDHYTIENGQVKVHRSRYFTRACPGPKGPLPSIGWEARREGVDDYRYLQLLKEEAEAASADPKMVAEIRKWFQKQHDRLLWYQMSARYKVYRSDGVFDVMDFFNPWPNITPEKYDQIREEAAAFIIRLNGK